MKKNARHYNEANRYLRRVHNANLYWILRYSAFLLLVITVSMILLELTAGRAFAFALGKEFHLEISGLFLYSYASAVLIQAAAIVFPRVVMRPTQKEQFDTLRDPEVLDKRIHLNRYLHEANEKQRRDASYLFGSYCLFRRQPPRFLRILVLYNPLIAPVYSFGIFINCFLSCSWKFLKTAND